MDLVRCCHCTIAVTAKVVPTVRDRSKQTLQLKLYGDKSGASWCLFKYITNSLRACKKGEG